MMKRSAVFGCEEAIKLCCNFGNIYLDDENGGTMQNLGFQVQNSNLAR